MSYEHKLALERIVTLCEKATNPTRRSERIFDIALEALGHTANQRVSIIGDVRKKTNLIKFERIQKMRERMESENENK